MTAMLCVPAWVHNPSLMSAFVDALEGTPMAQEAGEQLTLMASLSGLISQTVFGFSGILVAMVYTVITANNLVASEVDRGSMAYTLSTPTKRTKVVLTKAVFLVVSLVVMYAVVSIAGIFTIQAKHHAVWGSYHTADVVAAAKVLGVDEDEVAGNLSLIAKDPEAFRAGAAARDVDAAVYSSYLTQAMWRDASEAAAGILGVPVEEVEEAPSLIQNDRAALEKVAAIMGMDPDTVSTYIDQIDEMTAQMESLTGAFSDGLAAAAKHLGMANADLMNDMGRLKEDSEALTVAAEASGLDEGTIVLLVNQALAAGEVAADMGVDFDPFAFLMMTIGALLLMFAVGGISYLASCTFNLSRHSMALGAGLPFLFLILYFLSEVNTTLEPLRYVTLLTLFDTEQILAAGTYAPQFVILGVVGVVLYAFGIRIFKRRDLPL
jgi:ABC-2 type transport system permease protein